MRRGKTMPLVTDSAPEGWPACYPEGNPFKILTRVACHLPKGDERLPCAVGKKRSKLNNEGFNFGPALPQSVKCIQILFHLGQESTLHQIGGDPGFVAPRRWCPRPPPRSCPLGIPRPPCPRAQVSLAGGSSRLGRVCKFDMGVGQN